MKHLVLPITLLTCASLVSAQGFGGGQITDRPFSATEERHTLQTLMDGTRIQTSQSDRIYRDSMGRTRTERQKSQFVTIQDPVAGVMITLNAAGKTAFSNNMPPMPTAGPPQAVPANRVAKPVWFSATGPTAVAGTNGTGLTAVLTMAPPAVTSLPQVSGGIGSLPPQRVRDDNNKFENLGTQSVNNVLAEGTRMTMTIPVGQVGNDRPIETVNETWFSAELGMVVKTRHFDPRTGENTFEMMDISRAEPDPGLFRVPADYTVNQQGAPTILPAPAMLPLQR